MNEGQTHWEGCYLKPGHHHCAISRILDLEKQVQHWREARQSAIEAGDAMQAELAAVKADAEKARIAFFEMYQDWTKGDFELPKLAVLDIESIFATYAAINKARGEG